MPHSNETSHCRLLRHSRGSVTHERCLSTSHTILTKSGAAANVRVSEVPDQVAPDVTGVLLDVTGQLWRQKRAEGPFIRPSAGDATACACVELTCFCQTSCTVTLCQPQRSLAGEVTTRPLGGVKEQSYPRFVHLSVLHRALAQNVSEAVVRM